MTDLSANLPPDGVSDGASHLAPPDPLAWAHPIVREWFLGRFASATEPQALGWPSILSRRATLISAPTGSGKTLAAFLACIDRLVRQALTGALEDATEVVYVSPLKALSNDIQKNLQVPLGEIFEKAGQRGLLMPEIRVGLRTGDTLARERRAMLAHPPHILVTTPESLYILLTAEKSRANLRRVDTVIVDEIHAVADDKRGAHLALSLERLEALQSRPPVRIGLSATQKPIETVARFLVGSGRPLPDVVDVGHQRRMDLAVEVPRSKLGAVASNEMWGEIYGRLAELALQHRSTLVFVNTRRLSERVAHHLGERLGADAVAAHHGSLSRRLRLTAERKLKAGEIRLLVATASLELGIDIGFVDLVCQIGSPRSIAVTLQRVGRAGHWLGAIPKGRIFATTRDELLECAALVRSLRRGELDRLAVPTAPLDVLAQQMIAACAAEEWREDDLYALVRRAYPYESLSRAEFDEIAAMLSEGIAARRGRYGAYLFRDRVHHRLRARRGSRLAAITSGGAIPENALYTVVATPEDVVVGTVDEDFAVESLSGDVMLLGNTSWRIRRVERSRVVVEDAQGAAPNIPFWRGEAPPRTAELSEQLSELREKLGQSLTPAGAFSTEEARAATVAWLKADCGLDDAGAEQAVAYVAAGRAGLGGAIPSQTLVVAERFFDESGGMQLILHAPFGAAINKAWGLALRKRFCRSFNFELQAAATDNGLNISLSDQHSFPLADVFNFLHPNSVQAILEQAVLAAPVFGVRWRWVAGRSLELLRFQGGKKVPPQIQRMRAEDLLAAVFPHALACQENIVGDIEIPDHPLVRETMKDVLTEALDLPGLKSVLGAMADGRIASRAIDTTTPSPFCHEILNANPYAYLDDAPLEERRARAVEMRRVLPESVAAEFGRLDPGSIAEVREEAWPDVRDADELHDALFTLIALPIVSSVGDLPGSPIAELLARSLPNWRQHFDELAAHNRVARASAEGRDFWVCAERTPLFSRIFVNARLETALPQIDEPESARAESREDSITALLAGWMSHSGPTTARELSKLLALPQAEIEKAFLQLEARGTILRGQFSDDLRSAADANANRIPNTDQWCDRRLLARIHRLTLGGLRKQIEPVQPAQFMRWLLRWQHLAPGTQLAGERGLLEVLHQLQGFEAPANSWERQLLARRVSGYSPEMLDQLCLTGAAGWGRLSPHPATQENWKAGSRRVIPTSVAPIAFFVREDSDWMAAAHAPAHGQAAAAHRPHSVPSLPRPDQDRPLHERLSPVAREVHAFLVQRGASFFADIVRGTGKIKAEVETALWELVSAGLLTADGFDNLRALIDPKRRSGQGSGRAARPRHSTGRWSLLRVEEEIERSKSLEAACQMLLRRYGVVFREVLIRESILPPWRELLHTFRRLEDRGEVRGGRFVRDFLGEQFALPVAVESLRALRREAAAGEEVTVGAADPLNLAGIVVPGERVAANSGLHVAFRDGAVLDERHPSALAQISAVV